jgi:hypothetical protein
MSTGGSVLRSIQVQYHSSFLGQRLLLDGCEKFAGESKLSAAPRGRLAYSYFKKLQLAISREHFHSHHFD